MFLPLLIFVSFFVVVGVVVIVVVVVVVVVIVVPSKQKVKQVNQCFLLSCHADVCSFRKQLTFTLTSFLCLILVNICRFMLL